MWTLVPADDSSRGHRLRAVRHPVKRTGPRRYFVVSPAGALRWRVYLEGRPKSKTFWLKRNAVLYARETAMSMWLEQGFKSGVRVKNRKGVIIDEWSYGLDPHDTPG